MPEKKEDELDKKDEGRIRRGVLISSASGNQVSIFSDVDSLDTLTKHASKIWAYLERVRFSDLFEDEGFQ